MRSTGISFKDDALRIASGVGASQTQNVLRLSSLTYECTQVTPSSVLRSTTVGQAGAPSGPPGIQSPSGNARSTTYRGISLSVPPCDRCSASDPYREAAREAHDGPRAGCAQ